MSEMSRIMAIDHGLHNIGIALSDPLRMIARPAQVIQHVSRQSDFEAIAAAAKEAGVGRIILGVPTRVDGGLSRQAEIIVQWGCRLEQFLGLPVIGWDETNTSAAADKIAAENRGKRSSHRPVDDVAAAVLLQDYLDSGGTHGEPGQPIQAFADAI